MYTFTWIGADMVKCTQNIKDPVGAKNFYGILNSNPCIHGLEVFYNDGVNEKRIVFIGKHTVSY